MQSIDKSTQDGHERTGTLMALWRAMSVPEGHERSGTLMALWSAHGAPEGHERSCTLMAILSAFIYRLHLFSIQKNQ